MLIDNPQRGKGRKRRRRGTSCTLNSLEQYDSCDLKPYCYINLITTHCKLQHTVTYFSIVAHGSVQSSKYESKKHGKPHFFHKSRHHVQRVSQWMANKSVDQSPPAALNRQRVWAAKNSYSSSSCRE